MKLICPKSQLIEVINTVQRAVAPKTSLPILECIKIDDSKMFGEIVRRLPDGDWFCR